MNKPTRITQLRDPRGPGLPNIGPSRKRDMPVQMTLRIQQGKEKVASVQLSQRPALPGMVADWRTRFALTE